MQQRKIYTCLMKINCLTLLKVISRFGTWMIQIYRVRPLYSTKKAIHLLSDDNYFLDINESYCLNESQILEIQTIQIQNITRGRFISFHRNCQAQVQFQVQFQVPIPSPKSKSKSLKSKVQRKGNGTGADNIILQATHPTHPTHQ